MFEKYMSFSRNIIITGGAGFIGSNYIHYMFKKYDNDIRIINVDVLTYAGNLENLKDIEDRDNYTFIEGDIRDLDTCMEACKGVDYVLNQAAWGSVPRSIEMPLFYEEVNIRGTLNMMEATRNL